MDQIIMRWSMVVGQIIWRHEIMGKIGIKSTAPGISALYTLIAGGFCVALSLVAGTIGG